MKPGHPQYERFQRAKQELGHEDRNIRFDAAEALGEIGHPDGIKLLAKALNEEYYGIRGNAAAALGRIGHPDAIPHLTKALNDEHYEIRANAATALSEIAEAIKDEQPEHPAVIAAKHIDPKEHAKAFIKLYQALEHGEHKGKPKEWLTTYAKQLKALEGDLK
jgi:hypothetical protein